jgi:hypothetical protein
VRSHDPLVRQADGRLGLGQEAFEQRLVADQRRDQLLDRYILAQQGVLRQVDEPKTPAAEQSLDAVLVLE